MSEEETENLVIEAGDLVEETDARSAFLMRGVVQRVFRNGRLRVRWTNGDIETVNASSVWLVSKGE